MRYFLFTDMFQMIIGFGISTICFRSTIFGNMSFVGKTLMQLSSIYVFILFWNLTITVSWHPLIPEFVSSLQSKLFIVPWIMFDEHIDVLAGTLPFPACLIIVCYSIINMLHFFIWHGETQFIHYFINILDLQLLFSTMHHVINYLKYYAGMSLKMI